MSPSIIFMYVTEVFHRTTLEVDGNHSLQIYGTATGTKVCSVERHLMRWPLHQAIYDPSRNSFFFCDSSKVLFSVTFNCALFRVTDDIFRWLIRVDHSQEFCVCWSDPGRRQCLTIASMFIVFSRSRDDNRSISGMLEWVLSAIVQGCDELRRTSNKKF